MTLNEKNITVTNFFIMIIRKIMWKDIIDNIDVLHNMVIIEFFMLFLLK